jgi:catechol 2,3-dioxygenase-like lactoylglutathione lyase family enzyme
MKLHHVAIRTADIMKSIEFYELLGFTVKERFTAGYTLACWLEGRGTRLELMQIPQPKPAADAFYDEHYVGYYHLSFDITDEEISLPIWLEKLEEKFKQTSVIPLKILLPPQQQMILDRIYEVAFIADIDNLPIEIIRSC